MNRTKTKRAVGQGPSRLRPIRRLRLAVGMDLVAVLEVVGAVVGVEADKAEGMEEEGVTTAASMTMILMPTRMGMLILMRRGKWSMKRLRVQLSSTTSSLC